MTYTINRNGTDERLPFGAPFRDAVGVLHPWSVIAAWTDEELAAIGVTKVAVPVVEPEPLTLEQRKAMMVEAVNDRQWKVEIGGTVVAGIPIRTDEGSQNKIAGAVQLFERDPALTTINFRAQPDLWVALDQQAIIAIGIAVGRHVQAAYNRSRDLHEAIAAADSVEALDAIDIEAGWPPNG